MTSRILLLASALSALFLSACSPRPRNVPCTNAGDCEAAGDGFRYCLESRCVECLSDMGCGDGNKCTDGRCQRRCRDGRGCPAGEQCVDGMCSG